MKMGEIVNNVFTKDFSALTIDNYIKDWDNGQVLVDKIVKAENIEEDLRDVFRNLKLPFSPIPYVNRTVHKHYSEYYDEETMEVVKKEFQSDIIVGNYQFENK